MRIDFKADASMIATARNAIGADTRPRGRWLLLLSEVLQLAGPEVEFESHAERPWSSATFSGSRHTIRMSFHGSDGIVACENFVEALPDHEFTIPNRLVADATVSAVDHFAGPPASAIVEIELLLLDDC